MKVLHTISSLDLRDGGPTTCTYDLLKALNRKEVVSDILTFYNKDGKNSMFAGDGEDWIKIIDNDTLPFSAGFSVGLINWLRHNESYDIYHVNGLWRFINYYTAKIAVRLNRPYVLSTHGMLYKEALNRNPFLKKMMLKACFREVIENAACIHATSFQELEEIRNFGYKGHIAVIGNPVNMPQGLSHSARKKSQTIGFLGRLHPIKGVDLLLHGVSVAVTNGCKNFKLEIMGNGDSSYEQQLTNLVSVLNIEEYVHFVGFVSGKDKYDRLSNIKCLMVPSHQENFGMIVPEALLSGTPVYASKGTPWKILNEIDAGWWDDNTPESIANIISSVVSKSDLQLSEMASRGAKYVTDNFSSQAVADKMYELYQYILGQSNKPNYVYE